MNGLNYLLQTNLYILLFMGFYVLVLRNETFFRQNRFFLNTCIFLSFLIPFINSDWFRDLFITQKVWEAAVAPSQMIYDTIIVGVDEGTTSLTIADLIFRIYVVGAIILFIRFVIRLVFLKSNLKAEKGAAFSFFKTLVVDIDLPEAHTIINHEKVHMRQWHSADIIFIELAAIVNWFNPVMYLYKKEIRHIHEYIADEEAAILMKSKADYALLLFSNTLGVDPLHLSNNFFNKSLLKRRIIMLHKTKSRSTGLWKYGFSAPLFMLMLIVSAAAASSEKNLLSVDSERSITTIDNIAATPLSRAIIGGSNSAIGFVKIEGIGSTVVNSRAIGNPAVLKSGISSRITYSAAEKAANTFGGEQEVIGFDGLPADDKNPEFPGGMKAWQEYLLKTLKYPALAKANNIQGRVILSFTVGKDGSIEDIKILRGVGSGLDEEAVRVIALSPKWIPGTKDGVPVKVSYTTPINFALTATGNPATISTKPLAADVKDFSTVELLPEFIGGMAGWGKYLQSNLKYPAEAKSKNITGRVIMSFIVEKDGSLSEIKVIRGIGGGADEEALSVLQASPNWKPGIQDGRPVRVAYTMPIFFQLAAKPAEIKP